MAHSHRLCLVRGPGLLAILLSATAAAFFLLAPRFSFAVASPTDWAGLAVFVAVNVAVSFLCGKLHQSQRQSERQAAEVARQRQTLEATLASIGDGVIVTDAEGRVTFLNAVARQLTGWTLEEAGGRQLGEVFRIVN